MWGSPPAWNIKEGFEEQGERVGEAPGVASLSQVGWQPLPAALGVCRVALGLTEA